MDPASAGVTGGAMILSQLMQQAHDREEKRKQRLHEAEQEGFKTESEAAQALGSNQSAALSQLVNIYKTALGA